VGTARGSKKGCTKGGSRGDKKKRKGLWGSMLDYEKENRKGRVLARRSLPKKKRLRGVGVTGGMERVRLEIPVKYRPWGHHVVETRTRGKKLAAIPKKGVIFNPGVNAWAKGLGEVRGQATKSAAAQPSFHPELRKNGACKKSTTFNQGKTQVPRGPRKKIARSILERKTLEKPH